MLYFGIDDFIKSALSEDIGTGDITSVSCIPADSISHGRFIAKESCVVCGINVVKRVFAILDEKVSVFPMALDGERVLKGNTIAKVEGPSLSILAGERVALNLLQRLSGISTRTAEAVEAVRGTKAHIADTRKTTPGLRAIEKYAVKVGGGMNHRFNLADGVLIKDNHISAAGGISKAVELARLNVPHTLKIEVEVGSLEEAEEALAANADIIMLDNMSLEEMAEAVKLIDARALVEASGNMGERDLAAVAATGVDIISIGALTHSVHSVDISLKFR